MAAPKGKQRRHYPRRPVKMPEPDDVLWMRTTERVLYNKHLAWPVRRLSVEGVSPRVLAEFGAGQAEEEDA